MGSKQKRVQIGQKESFGRKLKARLALLSERGIKSHEIDKDPLVKNLRANIRAINVRMQAFEASEKKNEALAKMKADKAAPPQESPEGTKRKKVKEPPAEGKEKKKKKE
ncbi:MAG: hypothetical protein M0P04_06565 [Syntrophales bacterium]|jgi:hypothetical protein|nr:hypothetical protein [Syntrophales bacterium]HPB70125.1 hypothetical protein [Syntrophales bacterium]HQN25605.1 hypothetical protein [Syntrophales bacterium]HQP27982.1 hypothetical protein [Syntrophales bacterium]